MPLASFKRAARLFAHSPPTALVLAVLLLVTAAIYGPGLNGGFLFDDAPNITANPKVLIDSYSAEHLAQAALSGATSALGRPIPMLSFALDHAAHGLDPFYFKLTNLLIHLLVGISVYYLATVLLIAHQRRHGIDQARNIRWTALTVAAIWLLHPLNLSPVLYVVQRMTSLAALFMFWGVYFYARGRLLQLSGAHGTLHLILGLALFGVLGVFSKENALLLPLLMFVTEWCIFNFDTTNSRDRYVVHGFALITVVIPAIAAILYLLHDPTWVLGGYSNRDFTMEQRLLSEARILWFYLRLFYLPDLTQLGIFHDDLPISTSLFTPWTTLPAVLGIAALIGIAIVLRRREPLLACGVLFFFVGHLLESTILSLELAHEHRNYLPSFGLALILVVLGARLLRAPLLRRVLGIGILTVLAALTFSRAQTWGDELQFALSNVRHHPNSGRANIYAGQLFFQLADSKSGKDSGDYFEQAKIYFTRASRLDKYNLTGYFSLLVLDDRQGRPVNRKLLDDLEALLNSRPVAAASVNALISAHQCERHGKCAFPKYVLDRLFRATLSNPRLSGWNAVLVLSEAGQRALNHGDPNAALALLQKTIDIAPRDVQVRLNYANVLTTTRNYAAASKQLHQAEILDVDGYYAQRINGQWTLLNKAMAQTQ